MKKLICLIALLLVPVLAVASSPPEKQSWVCSQPGVHLKQNTYALSKAFKSEENHYELKEDLFAAVIQEITEGQFDPAYGASCRDFTTPEKAEKYLKKLAMKAEKRDFVILWVTIEH